MNIVIYLSDRYMDRILFGRGWAIKARRVKYSLLRQATLTTCASYLGRKWHFSIPMERLFTMHTKKWKLSVIKNSLCQRDQSARSLARTAFWELVFNGRVEFHVKCLETAWTTLRPLRLDFVSIPPQTRKCKEVLFGPGSSTWAGWVIKIDAAFSECKSYLCRDAIYSFLKIKGRNY